MLWGGAKINTATSMENIATVNNGGRWGVIPGGTLVFQNTTKMFLNSPGQLLNVFKNMHPASLIFANLE